LVLLLLISTIGEGHHLNMLLQAQGAKVELLKFTINCWIQFKQQAKRASLLWSLVCCIVRRGWMFGKESA